MSVNIKCIETGKVYTTIERLAKEMGVDPSAVSKAIKGKKNHCKGFHFQRTDEPPNVLDGKKICRCGNEFIPKTERQRICLTCRNNYSNKRPPTKQKINTSPFTANTNLMIVQDWEKYGNFIRLSMATSRTIESLYDQCEKLILNGQYMLIKKLLRIQSELQNHEVGVKIA